MVWTVSMEGEMERRGREEEEEWGRGRQWWVINLWGTLYLLRELFFSSSSTSRSSLW